jgi:hypothetical protein
MIRRQRVFRISKSIAGAVFAGLGMLILYEHVAAGFARLSHTLGANGSEALGVLPAALLAFSQTVQTYAVNHHRFLESVLQQVLVSSWPLLLVIFGTVLSKDSFIDEPKHIRENDLPCLCPTYSFNRSRPAASPNKLR